MTKGGKYVSPRTGKRAVPTTALSALLLLGCTCTKVEPHGQTANPTPSASAPIASAHASAPASAPSASPAMSGDWIEAVRLEQWTRAAHLIDTLPAAEQERDEIRYVRARVAIACKDHERAMKLLDGLERRLPLLAADVGYHRAEAQLHAGQWEEAARYFARSSTVLSLTKAARAWEGAGRHDQARAMIDRAIQVAKKRTDDDVVVARQFRANLSERAGDKAAAIVDLRFVARHAMDPAHAHAAFVRLEQLDPKHRLTSSDHMDRARELAGLGESERAIEEVDKAITAPGGPPTKVEQALMRARALYRSRNDYARAAQAYEQAAALAGAHVPEALYFAAKAWSRADDNERGLELYSRVIAKHPNSPWAERSSYFAPRLQRFQARWAQAEKGYLAYLKRYPRGAFADEARYELALCLLMNGKHGIARQHFEKLAHSEREALDASSYRYLAAVAAHHDGKSKVAVQTWRSLIESSPLSWFAMASAARLASVDQSAPPPISPAPTLHSSPMAVKLPHAARLLRDVGLDRDAEEFLRTVEDSIESAYGERGGEALCLAYQQLHTGGRMHRVGQRHAPARLVMMAPSSATRWAWECLYPRPYRAMVTRLEQRESLPPGLLYAIMRQESAFDPDAISPVGARGLMQLMPRTAEKTARLMAIEFDPDALASPGMNLDIGARYLAMLMQYTQGSIALSAASYNAGPTAVARWVARTQEVPLDVWVALIPYRETRRYVWRVLGNFARYRYLELGEAGIPSLDLKIPSGIQVPENAY